MIAEAKVHNAGHVILEDCMGSDLSIVNNARVSFNDESQEMDTPNIGLIHFLMRGGPRDAEIPLNSPRHGSPFESVALRFDIKAPLFVFREWHRHRAGHSYNEWSARYSEITPEFYIPSRDEVRSQVGKPGAYRFERCEDDSLAELTALQIIDTCKIAFNTYQEFLRKGIAKELARSVLPVGMYSRMKWTTNLRAAMHFVMLRNHEHAQAEIRAYAAEVENMLNLVCPVAMDAFREHGRVAP